MTREDIEEKAKQLYFEKDIMPIQLGVRMAEWMQEQKQAEIDELNNKVSELTEALDASHVFCEGVKKHYIKKACEWLNNEYFNGKLREIDGSWLVFEAEFIKAMKGE